MSDEMKQNEDLIKSIDTLIEDVFFEDIEKSIDVAKDADTKADSVVKTAPKCQDDDKRGAGRPAQISDVPKIDEDGKRAKKYDDDITENEDDEDENGEAKKQSKSVDQTTGADKSPKAPEMRPFKKSEIDEDEYAEFLAFKKSQEADRAEELKKAELDSYTDLVKAEVAKATDELKKSIDDLKKANTEKEELIKALGNTPMRAKSVTKVEALEKSENPELKGPEVLTKSQMLDIAEGLALTGDIKADHVMELEMTGTIYDAGVRAKIEAASKIK